MLNTLAGYIGQAADSFFVYLAAALIDQYHLTDEQVSHQTHLTPLLLWRVLFAMHAMRSNEHLDLDHSSAPRAPV